VLFSQLVDDGFPQAAFAVSQVDPLSTLLSERLFLSMIALSSTASFVVS